MLNNNWNEKKVISSNKIWFSHLFDCIFFIHSLNINLFLLLISSLSVSEIRMISEGLLEIHDNSSYYLELGTFKLMLNCLLKYEYKFIIIRWVNTSVLYLTSCDFRSQLDLSSLYLYILCLSVCLSICLFVVSNKRQNGYIFVVGKCKPWIHALNTCFQRHVWTRIHLCPSFVYGSKYVHLTFASMLVYLLNFKK